MRDTEAAPFVPEVSTPPTEPVVVADGGSRQSLEVPETAAPLVPDLS